MHSENKSPSTNTQHTRKSFTMKKSQINSRIRCPRGTSDRDNKKTSTFKMIKYIIERMIGSNG